MTLTEKQEDFLVESIEYFGTNPEERRCSDKGGCYYSPEKANKPNSEGCMIGRHLTKKNQKLADKVESGCSIENVLDKKPRLIPKKLKDLGEDFLTEAQGLHDNERLWDVTYLTHVGKSRLKRIIEHFGLNEAKFEKYL